MARSGRYSNNRRRGLSGENRNAKTESEETDVGPSRSELFSSLVEARDATAWRVNYSHEDGSETILMFGDCEATVRKRFAELSSDEVDFETATEWRHEDG